MESLFFRFAEKRSLSGMTVAVWRLTTSEERAFAFDKLGSALALIEEYAPNTLTALRSDAPVILVAALQSLRGCYFHRLGMLGVEVEYVLDVQASPRSLACLLVHEAQHARLYRLGFGFDEPIRGRIERLCYRAQRNFARRLPDAHDLVAEAEAWIEADLDLIYSKQAYRERRLSTLKTLGCPDWLVRAAAWFDRRRAT